MRNHFLFYLSLYASLLVSFGQTMAQSAPAPLYRDPITDGAADPVVIYNRQEKSWWMLYTQRRANTDAANVAYCYGNRIGIAETKDHGQTWVYRGILDLDFEKGHNTFWAPDVVYHQGLYHLFVSYIQGVRNNWGGQAHILHYTSPDLWEWKYEGPIELSSNQVIDATLLQMSDGTWRMWYKDEVAGAHTLVAESTDLYHWKVNENPAIDDRAQEGAKVFFWKDAYWMLTDEWQGMRVYRSKDANTWERQGLILDKPSSRTDDTPSGAHGDVVVQGEKAYVFYFTHPGREKHTEAFIDKNGVIPYEHRRSSIQVAPLTCKDNTLICNRDSIFDFYLNDIP